VAAGDGVDPVDEIPRDLGDLDLLAVRVSQECAPDFKGGSSTSITRRLMMRRRGIVTAPR